VKEVTLPNTPTSLEASSFLACLATILELPLERLPQPRADEDPASGWTVSRWLGGLGLGIARVSEPASFSWAGPWIARIRPPGVEARHVVMYGVPSGLVWDPGGNGNIRNDWIDAGFLLAAADIALALPPLTVAPIATGTIEAIWIAPAAGERAQHVDVAQALAGRGLAGDRHVAGTGTFPSSVPGSALTLIEAEVCESFNPPLGSDEHRRNLVTHGIGLNSLVGHEFRIGATRFRGVRLCEPCTVVNRYASRSVLCPLVHRGGLRADILEDGEIRVGDQVLATTDGTPTQL
jgi:MOSC domain-containing protein YiiM